MSLGNLDYVHPTSIQCIHGDLKSYPVTDVTVCIEDQAFILRVEVFEYLPQDLILGKDVPVLYEFIHDQRQIQVSCPKT